MDEWASTFWMLTLTSFIIVTIVVIGLINFVKKKRGLKIRLKSNLVTVGFSYLILALFSYPFGDIGKSISFFFLPVLSFLVFLTIELSGLFTGTKEKSGGNKTQRPPSAHALSRFTKLPALPALILIGLLFCVIFFRSHQINKQAGKSNPISIPSPSTFIAFEQNIRPLLEEFARANWESILPFAEENYGESRNLLLEVLESPTPELEIRIKDEKERLASIPISDAPEMRATFEAEVKLCLAEALLKNDLKKTLFICGIGDPYPNTYQWQSVDDITASAEVLPFFLTGFGYYQASDPQRANFYFTAVVEHQKKVHDQYGESLISGETYLEITTLSNKLIVK